MDQGSQDKSDRLSESLARLGINGKEEKAGKTLYHTKVEWVIGVENAKEKRHCNPYDEPIWEISSFEDLVKERDQIIAPDTEDKFFHECRT